MVQVAFPVTSRDLGALPEGRGSHNERVLDDMPSKCRPPVGPGETTKNITYYCPFHYRWNLNPRVSHRDAQLAEGT